MRKILVIVTILLFVPSSWAQHIWVSADNNSHYVDIEYRANINELILLTDKQKPALEYIGQLLDMYRDKIKSKQWSVWVESYVRQDGNSVAQNRVGAKLLSNTIKSYLISNYKIVESDFTTRNYSGTISGRQSVTTIIIGMRYPLEKILPEQLIDWEYSDLVWLTDMAKADSMITVSYEDVTTLIPGMDTTKIYSPYFEPITFTYRSPTPALMEAKDGQSAASTTGAQGSGVSDSLLVIQKALQDSLNSPTYTPSASSKRRVDKQIKQAKQKRDRVVGVGSSDIVPFNSATRISGIGTSLGVAGVDEGSTLSITDHDRVMNEYLKAQNAPNKEWSSQKDSSRQSRQPLYAPSPNYAAFVPGLSNGVEVKRVDPNSSIEWQDKKIRVKKIRKSDFQPKVTVGSDGRMLLDATGLERSLNIENYIQQENEDRARRIAEKHALREQAADQRLAKYRAIQQTKGRFAIFGVGVNALTSLALIPSMQLDAYFSDRFSAIVEGFYSKWSYVPDYKFNISMISPELRFYPMGKRKAFEGLYVGLYGSYGQYNMRWDSRTGYQNDFISAGLSLGYVLPLGGSGFYMEAGLSAGYISQWGEKYLYHQGDNYHVEPYSRTDAFYPTKVKVSFVYRVFNKKKNFEREND